MPEQERLIAGRYRLAEEIGRGGMGTVWRATDELLGRPVAVKRLHLPAHLADDEIATLYERTRREARAAARVSHPNVITVHDVVDDDGLPCIVMEYVPSATLADLLADGRALPPPEAARVGLGMVAALRAAHAAGVLHRDVKPGNVLLGADGRVVLSDFGIATATGTATLTRTGQVVGSIDYLAPERVRGRTPGPASDLWALGATLYQAVEGRPPFRKDTALETGYAIATDPLQPPHRAGALAPLIAALLAKDPDQRPSAEAVEDALRAVARQSPDAAPAPPPAAPPTAPVPPPLPVPPTVPVPPVGPAQPVGPPAQPMGSPQPARPGPPVPSAPPLVSTRPGPPHRPPAARGPRGRARTALWGTAAALVVAAAAVAGWLYGTGGDHGSPGGQAREGTRKDVQDGGRRSAPGTAGPDSGTVAPASPTAGPATAPPPASGPSAAPPPVPAGYHLVHEPRLGVSVPVPDGWRRVVKRGREDMEVDYVDPAGTADLKINVLEFASADHLQHWKQVEAQFKADEPTYRLLRMQSTQFRGQPAAVWEFTFAGRTRTYRAIDLGFGREGEREYALYLSAPERRWEDFRPVFDTAGQGLRLPG
ncbi:serine/threonine-protein kinase [Streptomyces sp. B1866]|uniref:serine/threonine-protein kinase n=1 Tax=Streptomyces sp. B1866 TaxID=3075431 RepID=UPI00288E3346|nr:serine/threonine-protein kinase [Streptomyces sp. B1866]MDT3398573.1 serine/threonine-protein kinase [Streptomyces sp. B1866]